MRERGFALIHVVIMGVLLALIASYLLSWSFGRYQMVARHKSFTAGSGQIEACYNQFMSTHHDMLSGGTMPAVPFTWACPGWGSCSSPVSGCITVDKACAGPTCANTFTITMSAPVVTH